MIKGVIADVNGSRAVLITENGEFITIRNEKYAIGQKIVYRKPSISRMSVIAACLALVLILGSIGTKTYFTSTSYIDVDINPSVRLVVNNMNQVIKALPLNDDAVELLATEKISGDIKNCINALVDASVDKGYINEDNTDVEIVVISNKAELIESVNVAIEEVNNSEITVMVDQAGFDELKEAESLNISVPRLKALEEYTEEFGGSIDDNTKSLAKATNSEIRAMKNKKEDVVINTAETPDILISATPEPKATEAPIHVEAKPTVTPDNKPLWTPSIKPVITEIPETTDIPVVAVRPTKAPVVFTSAPTKAPMAEPTKVPTPEPTKVPTVEPTAVPTVKPTNTPTVEPTATPTVEPTATPTVEPTATPTVELTATPTVKPTETPTVKPTHKPDKGDDPSWPWWDWVFGDILE